MQEENLEEEAEHKSKNGEGESTESTQQVRALAVKFEDLENRLPKIAFCSPNGCHTTCVQMCRHTHAHTINTC